MAKNRGDFRRQTSPSAGKTGHFVGESALFAYLRYEPRRT
jgi:hypothetical protein